MVKHSYPHDPQAFTQGLFYKDGFLYESTGLEGHSSIRKVQLETGRVLQKKRHRRRVLRRRHRRRGQGPSSASPGPPKPASCSTPRRFTSKRKFSYTGEGWGLTSNDKRGHHERRQRTPSASWIPRRCGDSAASRVTAEGKPVDQLNELEWVEGEIFANIWRTDRIARIDPETGKVVGWIDLHGPVPTRPAGRRARPTCSTASPTTPAASGCSSPASTGRSCSRSSWWNGSNEKGDWHLLPVPVVLTPPTKDGDRRRAPVPASTYRMWCPTHQAIAAMKADAGMVKIQAQTMLPATPQRTADGFLRRADADDGAGDGVRGRHRHADARWP